MRKYILFFLLLGVAYPQSKEELQKAKETIAEIAIENNELKKINKSLSETTSELIRDLQAIENPGDSLVAVLKKYNIYKEKK